MLFPPMYAELAPSPWAIRMRPFFLAVLVLLMAIVIGKFVISDFWGAVSLVLVVVVGVLVVTGHHGINATNALFYCVMAVMMAIFDVISCVLYFQHSKYHIFDPRAPVLVILAQSIFLLSPIVLFTSATLSYSIFTDCRNNSEAAAFGLGPGIGFGPGFANYGVIEGLGPREPRLPGGPGAQPRQIPNFQGHGHRLGNDS